MGSREVDDQENSENVNLHMHAAVIDVDLNEFAILYLFFKIY